MNARLLVVCLAGLLGGCGGQTDRIAETASDAAGDLAAPGDGSLPECPPGPPVTVPCFYSQATSPPAGACEPSQPACQIATVEQCFGGGQGAMRSSYCTCYTGAWSCSIASQTKSVCLPADACGDADAAVPADASVDAPADVDLDSPLGWLGELDGIWLFGWIGNLNRFSWVRINGTGQMSGTADFLDGAALTMNGPVWPSCNGAGTWMVTQKPDTIGFEFPTSCSLGFAAYTFDSFSAPGTWPKGAILAASITPEGGPSGMVAYRFPSSQCDANMTSCTDPLK